jgi:hypothetical protein
VYNTTVVVVLQGEPKMCHKWALHGNYFKYPIGGNISYTTSLGLKSKLERERERERNNPKSQTTHEIDLLLRRTKA